MMTYFLPISLILVYSTTIAIISKKRIEQTIPIGLILIVLIVYLFGIFDNLKLGITAVEILAVIQMLVIAYMVCKQKDNTKIKEKIKKIITPGLVVYLCLCAIAIWSNQGRMFENHDEFTHWGKIVKNMFQYNTYGTNAESAITFNEYPPFTATFQYIFVAIKNEFSETIPITAQCILYFSIIIPITKNIKWDKSIKNLGVIIPMLIFIPMIFYSTFYIDIMADGILGVMFGTCIFYACQKEEFKFKYTKIFTMLIMMTLTKTSGIGLAGLAIFIITIKNIINIKNSESKMELKGIAIGVLLLAILTGVWYIKTKNATKTWDFTQYLKTENTIPDESIGRKYIKAIFESQSITEKRMTVFTITLALICINMYLNKQTNEKNKTEQYYQTSMLVSIAIYILFLYISYTKIFKPDEAEILSCFERYASTILLANAIFQMLKIVEIKKEINFKTGIVILTILACMVPQYSIMEKYIHKEEYLKTSGEFRNEYTKIRLYKKFLKQTDKVLYIIDSKYNIKYIMAMNNYELMPVQIKDVRGGAFYSDDEFKEAVKDYDYVYIYKIKSKEAEQIKSNFENNLVLEDILYQVKSDKNTVKLAPII